MKRCLVWGLALAVLVLNLAARAAQFGDFSYTTNATGVAITGYNGLGGGVTIPSQIEGVPVTEIAVHAFERCTRLYQIAIPDSVHTVGARAFASCSSLNRIALPNGLTTIQADTFGFCTALTSVQLGNRIASIGDHAFYFCSSLTDFTVPNTVTSLGASAFECCWTLTNATISTNLTSIADRAFWACTKLRSVAIPRNITRIGNGAFAGCEALVALYFVGNAPGEGWEPLGFSPNAVVYYLPGTSGWGPYFNWHPTALWNPTLQDTTVSRIGPSLTITGTPNLPILLEAATDLASPVWVPLLTTNLSGGSLSFADAQATNLPARFYRVRSP